MDVTPTVLHYMDSPVPSDCDGRVVKEVFDSASEPYQRPVARRVFDAQEHVALGPHPYVGDEQAEIEERLKALGYL
jgi:arylsulfatase A-like enzyme